MKQYRRMLIGTSLTLALAGFWSATLGDEAVTAQQRKPIKITRIFTGADGQTHSEELDARLAPGGSGSELSETIKVTGLQFRRTSPNYFVDWHTAPQRQYVVTLSGRGEVELQGGKKIPLEPGHILLAEDTTGKGHISRGVGSEDRISLFIQLAQ